MKAPAVEAHAGTPDVQRLSAMCAACVRGLQNKAFFPTDFSKAIVTSRQAVRKWVGASIGTTRILQDGMGEVSQRSEGVGWNGVGEGVGRCKSK